MTLKSKEFWARIDEYKAIYPEMTEEQTRGIIDWLLTSPVYWNDQSM